MGVNIPGAHEGSQNHQNRSKNRKFGLGALALVAAFLTGCGQKLPPELLKICGMNDKKRSVGGEQPGREQSALDPAARIPMRFQRVTGPITFAIDPSTGTPEDMEMLAEAIRSPFIQEEMRKIGHSFVLVS